MTFDSAYIDGARNAVRALGVRPGEKVSVITDQQSEEIAAAISAEIELAGAGFTRWVLEDAGSRPITTIPDAIARDLDGADACVAVVAIRSDEPEFCRALAELAAGHGVRYLNVSNVDRRAMLESMRADYALVDRFCTRMLDMLKDGGTIRAANPAGTKINARVNGGWHKNSGVVPGARQVSLPAGEIWTRPESVDGVYVADGVIGNYFSERFGDIRYTPLEITIADGEIAGLRSDNADLRAEFEAFVNAVGKGARVSELAIGANTVLYDISGNIVQDSKIPGVYLSFGDASGGRDDAAWGCATQVQVIGRFFDAWINDVQFLSNAKFVIPS
ncbi:MAG: hypothetical protein IT168_15265 [Bryobacterales bacterium]|nr:hypothetical protein [Bryobacterales bacterium]